MLYYIKYAFDAFLSVYGIWILLALGIALAIKFLSYRQSEAALIEAYLGEIDKYLKLKFGVKSVVIVEAIRKGLDDIKDGEFTDQEMLDLFIMIVKARISENINEPLSEEENNAIEEVAQMTLSSFSDNKKRNLAFKMLSKN